MSTPTQRKPRADRGKKRAPERHEAHIQARINAAKSPANRHAVEFWQRERRRADAVTLVVEALLALKEKKDAGYQMPISNGVQMHAATIEVFEQLRTLAAQLRNLDLSGIGSAQRASVEIAAQRVTGAINVLDMLGQIEIADDDEWD